MRIDKWLWAARFYKTRALASKACDLGRIISNDHSAKPSREVRLGDMVTVKNDAGEFRVEVLLLNEMRGPSAVAQSMYRETEDSIALRAKLAEERRALPSMETNWEGRPSKRDRRVIERFRGRG